MEFPKPRICVDFDNTIFDGLGILPGCIETLSRLRERYSLAIFSARATEAERRQMKDILDLWSVPYDEILAPKPLAEFYIDDRGIRFDGWDKVCVS